MTDTPETKVNKTGDTVRLETKIKRGTGTRDQDTIKVKVYGDDPEKTAVKLQETLKKLRMSDVSGSLRETQPTDEYNE